MSDAYPFQRIVVVNPGSEPDVELLQYAAMTASFAENPEILIVSPAGERVMRSLAPISRCVFENRVEAKLSFRILFEPDLDLLFELAREWDAELIVVRHPRRLKGHRLLIRQLLFESPCSVCLVPQDARASMCRPTVRIEPTDKGAMLLSIAAAASKHAGSEELFIVRLYFKYGLDSREDTLERLREEQTLEMYCFLARAELSGVNCRPILEESPRQAKTLLKLAAENDSDLLIIDPSAGAAPIWQWNGREAESVAKLTRIPLLVVRSDGPRRRFTEFLREEVFCEMEPMFN
jgi:nucleotide-binding universal stress UspA family protein